MKGKERHKKSKQSTTITDVTHFECMQNTQNITLNALDVLMTVRASFVSVDFNQINIFVLVAARHKTADIFFIVYLKSQTMCPNTDRFLIYFLSGALLMKNFPVFFFSKFQLQTKSEV